MKARVWTGLGLASLALVAAGAALGFWYAQSRAPEVRPVVPRNQVQGTDPVAHVRVATIKRGRIAAHLTAYGSVVAAQGKGRRFSLPYETRISRVLTVPGQEVRAGSPLIELAPSPPTALRLAHARSQRNSARQELALLRRQMRLGMVTRQQVLRARRNLNAAELNLKSLEREGAGRPRIIRARAPGVVSRVMVQAGQLVPAGKTMVETIGRADLVVRLGIEREDVGLMRIGQPVRLWPIDKASVRSVSGRVSLITHQVDPRTRLVSVYVRPDRADRSLWLNEYVKGRFVVASRQGLWVPPAAVLPCQDGSHEIFTVKAGRAVRCLVRKGLENSRQVQVVGPGISEGQPVIVVGNSQVSDHMAVKVETVP